MTNAKKNPVNRKINPLIAIVVFSIAVFAIAVCVSFVPSDNAAENDYECLNFTFPDGGGHLSLSVRGSINPDCQYRIGTEGDWAILPKEGINVGGGKTVYIKGNNTDGFFIDGNNYATFVLTVNRSSQTVSSSGSVMSLINGDGNDTVIPCDYCFSHLFYECAALSSAPALPATVITTCCYESMFSRCTSLTKAPELNAEVLAAGCYSGMFSGCTSLKTPPELPATEVAQACYGMMFSKSGLETAPALPATALADHCYVSMFESCGSLRVAPALPATALANSCYMNMFIFCGNLSSAPILPAKDLVDGCYMSMFSNCTNIERISCLAETMVNGSTIDWIGNVSATGRFYTPNPEIWKGKDVSSGIPKNWTVNEAAIDPNGGSFDDGSWTYHEDTGKYTKEFSGGTTWTSIISAEESHLSRTGYDFSGWDPQPGPTEYLGFPCTDIKALWTPHSFDVTLDSRGGSVSPGKIHVTYDSPYGELPVPVKTGYAFAGWFTAAEGGSEVTSSTICKTDGEHTLYAHWTANTETVVLSSGYEGGIDGEAEIVFDSKSFTKIDILTRTGYTLLGYFDGNTKVINPDGKFAAKNVPGWIENEKWKKDGKDITLTAHWKANVVTVKLESGYQGGKDGEAEITFDSKSFTEIDILTRTGYTLLGYFDGNTKIVNADKTFASDNIPGWIEGGKWKKDGKDITLTAKWKANEYVVTFDAKGGEPELQTMTETFDSNYILPSEPTKIGYTFLGWFTDETGGTEITSGTKVNITAPQTLYAHWEANDEIVKLKSGYQGGTDGEAEIVFDSKSFTKIDILTRTGYTLLGYYSGNTIVIDSDGKFASSDVPGWIENGKWKKDGKNITLTAKWDANEYTVTFNANGGVPASQTKTETFDSNYIFPSEPTMTGHTFLGWFTDETGGIEVTSGTKVKTAGDHTLYAHWRINQYTITFDTDGGSYVEPITQDYGTDVTAPENPTKKGYKFDKWDKDMPPTMPAENIMIKALWIPNSVTVSFEANGGTGTMKNQPITYGVGDMKLNPCTFKSSKGNTYYFAWNTKAVVKEKGTWFMEQQSMKEYLETNTGTTELKLYAQWSIETKPDKSEIAPGDPISFTLTVSYDHVYEVWVSGDEEPLVKNEDYEVNELQSNDTTFKVTLLPNYTQKLTNGRYIVGIYFDDTVGYCGFDISSPTPRTVFPVIYYSNGGSAPAPEAYNVNLRDVITIAPYGGTKDGYVFGGWLYNGVKIVKPGEKIEVKEPITLTAVWIFVPAGSHTVTFDADGGSDSPSAITVGEGCTFTVPEYKGTKDGYTFKGWSYDGKTYKASDVIRMEKSDIMMKAVWEKNPEPAPENNTGMIVGIVVAAVAAVVLIGGAVFFARRK